MHTIDGRRDIAGGRLMTDRRSAANSTSGKYFTTISYSADGSYIFAGGNSKYICMYDVADKVSNFCGFNILFLCGFTIIEAANAFFSIISILNSDRHNW